MKMYQVVEINGKRKESYTMMFESDAEMGRYLENKRAFEDERKYSITAWNIKSDGYGCVILSRYGYIGF